MTTFKNSLELERKTSSHIHENKYISFFNECPEGMFCINLDGFFTDVNPALITLGGYTRQELINTLFLDLVFPENLGETIAKFEKVKKGFTQHLEICLLHKNGYKLYTAITAIPVISNDLVVGIHGMIKDITESEFLQKMSSCDQLTKLPNRNQFSIHLKEELALLKPENLIVAVMFLNLDRFEMVNDILGHDAGDQILKLIAHRLRNCISKQDIVARLGGDEFLIASKRKEVKEIEQLANHILQSVAEPIFFKGQDFLLTTSIGISLANNQDSTNDLTMIRHANIAMHSAKAIGGKCYKFYSKIIGQIAMRKTLIEKTLKRALAKSEFEIYYQPQFNLNSNRIEGVEALIRWNHPHLGLISPLEFIPIAEETNFIIPLGEWILKSACNQFRQWLDQGFKLTRLSVNISVIQLYQKNFYELVIDTLEKTGLDPSYLELEITESKMLNFECVKNKIQALRDKGIKIAIDDFGTGYSPLSHLSQIYVDTLKIDRGFIKNICQNLRNQVIVQSIVKMARLMELNIIVEGVETPEQLLLLKKHKLNEVQGFYFSPPVPTEEFEKMMIA